MDIKELFEKKPKLKLTTNLCLPNQTMELMGGKWKSYYYLIDAKKDTAIA
jgi:hypothetical protein